MDHPLARKFLDALALSKDFSIARARKETNQSVHVRNTNKKAL